MGMRRPRWCGWRGWCLLILCWCNARGDQDWSDCSHIPLCSCKWSGGKKTAACPSAGLRRPPPLSPDIQVLDLHGNTLTMLESDIFASSGLLNLQRINLRAAKVRSIHADAFKSLRILVEIDLADNELISLPSGTFKGNERLRLLVLSGNPISSLARDQFPPLPHLRTLDLSRCRLKKIHSTALQPNNLPQLDALDLSRNLLESLQRDALASLPSLKTLRLTGNPWRCDCHLKNFSVWFLNTNLATERISCSEPSSRSGISWMDINSTDMTCPPEAQATSRIVRSDIGSDVTFGCLIRGDPQPLITWLFDGVQIGNGTIDGEIQDIQPISENEDNQDSPTGEAWWVNMTIVNVTNKAAGDWTCSARNEAGQARAVISVVLPRYQTATARTAPGIPTLLGVVIGALLVLALLGMVATSVCWRFRRRRVPPSRSFTDQEKRLLDASIVVSCDRSIAELASPCDFEMTERSASLGEETPRSCTFDPVHITIEGSGTDGLFPPPPAEFALPAPYGNIFISVSVTGSANQTNSRREFPDLLGSLNGATLPRRSRQYCPPIQHPSPAYDNMGPRVTAAGSSTWSLPGASEGTIVPISVPLSVPPPAEFVSL